jgi:hypothetical protein
MIFQWMLSSFFGFLKEKKDYYKIIRPLLTIVIVNKGLVIL